MANGPKSDSRELQEQTEKTNPEQERSTEEGKKGSFFDRFSRRAFLTQLGAAGIAAGTQPLLAAAQTAESADQKSAADSCPGAVPVSLRVNGQVHELRLEPRVTLLDALRENLGLPGTKKGCDHGQCGACTVHVTGRRINSCLTFAIMHQQDEITTIEGLAKGDQLHPMQTAFMEHDAFQCGYCTPGQIMSAVALLKEPWGADETAVREAMSGNICRCGAYNNIVAAVQSVRTAQKG